MSAENLCDLPDNMVVEIAKRLKKLEDFTSFRGVSKTLRDCVKEEYFEGLRIRQRIPYLMLPVRDGNDNIREFYSLIEGESIVASVEIPKFKSKKCFESLGWLLVVQEDGNMTLLDPFSGTEIPLPHQNTFPGYELLDMDEHIFIQKMLLSARPSETSDFVLMIIAGGDGHLAFWRQGDKAWNRIETRRGRFKDVIHGGGNQFYAISYPGIVWVFNLDQNDKEGRIVARCESILYHNYRSENLYILKTVDGSLLVITRTIPHLSKDGLSYITAEFEVFEVDIETNTLEEIDSLGSMAVFLGHNSSIAVDASRFSGRGIKANHIYFTDDDWERYHSSKSKGGGMDSGVYNLETGDIKPIYPGELLLSKVSPSTWITPCF